MATNMNGRDSLFQHFSQKFDHQGVNLSPAEHSKSRLAEIRASWVQMLLRSKNTKGVNFDGTFHQGLGDGPLIQGALENVVQKVLKDHAGTSGKWPNKKRFRNISYVLDYDVRIDTVAMSDKEEDGGDDVPWEAPELPKELFNSEGQE